MHQLSRRVHGTLALCIAAVVGCSSTAPAPKGSLTVTITPNDGTTPAVAISGPNGYSNTISTSQTISGLALGNYTIVADSAVGPDSVVGTITDTGTVTGSPATVVAGTPATVTVAYSTKDRVGGMWVANNDYYTIPELGSSQLRTTAAVTPADTLATMVSGPAGVAIDANGNMWVSSYSSDSLDMYTPAARNAGAGTAPSAVIVSPAVGDAENITFDANGNLWIANCNGNVLEFTPAQQTAAGAQTPNVAIGSSLFECPWSLAFDGSGNLWVADYDAAKIVEFSAAQLAASGSPTPIDTIGANAGSLDEADGLAFDASGNLWVTNGGSETVVEYTKAQLAAGGAPVPATTINMPSNSFPFGAAFDRRGTLWVTDDDNGTLYGLSASQLAGGGTPTPSVALTVTVSNGFEPEQPVFDPYATGAPISGARLHAPVGSLSHHAHRPSMNRLQHVLKHNN